MRLSMPVSGRYRLIPADGFTTRWHYDTSDPHTVVFRPGQHAQPVRVPMSTVLTALEASESARELLLTLPDGRVLQHPRRRVAEFVDEALRRLMRVPDDLSRELPGSPA